jgi:mannose/cellobiose epimerase-like protein (N-acyl-D-glucosamine 2-epimerase family)
MKRRKFLGACAAATASVAAPAILAGCKSKPAGAGDEKSVQARPRVDRLAGKPLAEIIAQYRSYLFDDFLPFVEKYVVDREYGGFICHTDLKGNNISTEKNTWYQGRGLWSISFLYNKLAKKPEYLEIAGRTADFILQTRPEGDSFWPANFSRQGKPVAPPAPNFYGDLFIALGLQEYAKASGREQYWDLAREIMMKGLRVYDRPDYFPEAARGYVETLPLIPGARIGGHWFMLLNLATLMLEAKPDAELEAIADRAIDAVMNSHYNPEFDLINEVINHDLSRPDNDIAQLVHTGHNTETLWMTMAEAVRRKDTGLFERAAAYFKRNLEVAWDDVYGGVFTSLNHVDRFEWLTRKANWAQAETIIGLLLIIEQTGAEWAKTWFDRVFTYFSEKYPLKKYGYPLWIDYADRKVTFVEKDYSRTEILHHPRHLMMAILILERMRQGGMKQAA